MVNRQVSLREDLLPPEATSSLSVQRSQQRILCRVAAVRSILGHASMRQAISHQLWKDFVGLCTYRLLQLLRRVNAG